MLWSLKRIGKIRHVKKESARELRSISLNHFTYLKPWYAMNITLAVIYTVGKKLFCKMKKSYVTT